jgi:hypothetical protein
MNLLNVSHSKGAEYRDAPHEGKGVHRSRNYGVLVILKRMNARS